MMTEGNMKTAAELDEQTGQISIDELKRQWLSDPCWDIEESKGFEAQKQELYIFRLETENRRMREELRQIAQMKRTLHDFLGL